MGGSGFDRAAAAGVVSAITARHGSAALQFDDGCSHEACAIEHLVAHAREACPLSDEDALCYARRYYFVALQFGADVEQIRQHYETFGRAHGLDPWCERAHCTMRSSQPRALVHVGPHKTGTTHIQSSIVHLISELNLDCCETPSILDVPGEFANYYCDTCKATNNVAHELDASSWGGRPTAAWPGFVRFLQRARARHRNVVLSAEDLSRPNVDISRLAGALASFDTSVVLMYRHFFEWLVSQHFEENRPPRGTRTIGEWASSYRPIVDSLSHDHVVWAATASSYALATRERYLAFFTDVTVIDYHDTDDIASALLCDESRRLELRATCSALALLSGDGDTSTKNVKTGLDLADIVAAAYARNLVGASETFAGLKAKLEPLVLGRRDLPRRCISHEITHMIRELSERAEEVLVPESRASAPQRLASAFLKTNASAAFCSIDTARLFATQDWLRALGATLEGGGAVEATKVDESLAVIIVEPRNHAALTAVVDNLRRGLGEHVPITLYHGRANRALARGLAAHDSSGVHLVELGVDDLSGEEYSALLLQPTLWAAYERFAKVLVAQSDSGLCQVNDPRANVEFVASLADVDIVGAPGNWTIGYEDGRVSTTLFFNGGFTLRNPRTMRRLLVAASGGKDLPAPLATIEGASTADLAAPLGRKVATEDRWFSAACERDAGCVTPDLARAATFACCDIGSDCDTPKRGVWAFHGFTCELHDYGVSFDRALRACAEPRSAFCPAEAPIAQLQRTLNADELAQWDSPEEKQAAPCAPYGAHLCTWLKVTLMLPHGEVGAYFAAPPNTVGHAHHIPAAEAWVSILSVSDPRAAEHLAIAAAECELPVCERILVTHSAVVTIRAQAEGATDQVAKPGDVKQPPPPLIAVPLPAAGADRTGTLIGVRPGAQLESVLEWVGARTNATSCWASPAWAPTCDAVRVQSLADSSVAVPAVPNINAVAVEEAAATRLAMVSVGIDGGVADATPRRLDACSRADMWARIPVRATNTWLVESAIAASPDRASRHGDVPMLRALRDRTALPALLAELGCAGPRAAWAELGVLRGEFSAFLLRESEGATVHLIDLWGAVNVYDAASGQANFVATRARVAKFGERAVFHRARTADAARTFADGSLDFVYVDATHTYEGASRDLLAWWPKVRIGGLMAGDDYHNGYVPVAGHTFGVKDAVDEFFGGAGHDHRVYTTTRHDVETGQMPQWYVLKCSDIPRA